MATAYRVLTSEMDVHLVSVEVGVVRVTVGVVHPDRLLSDEHLCSVTHHTRLVQRRLSVEQQDVSVPEMTEDLLVDRSRLGRQSSARGGRLLGDEQLVGDRGSLVGRQLVERDLASVRVDDHGRSRVDLGSVDDRLLHLLEVVVRDRLRERELAREHGRHSDLVRLEVDVGRDDGSGGVVDSLSLEKVIGRQESRSVR